MSLLNKFKKIKSKIKILYFLKKYNIKDYELIEDEENSYIVNVNGNVCLIDSNLKSINIQFNEVSGYFDCSYNQLKSLKGCPKVVKDFYCNYNKLTSLEFSPEIVNGNFNCGKNNLNNLDKGPNLVTGNYNCSFNFLTSLKGCANIIEGYFDCSFNFLIINYLKDIEINKIGGLIYLLENKELGNLQYIKNFEELNNTIKDIVKIQKEKENLLNIINKENFNKINNIKKI